MSSLSCWLRCSWDTQHSSTYSADEAWAPPAVTFIVTINANMSSLLWWSHHVWCLYSHNPISVLVPSHDNTEQHRVQPQACVTDVILTDRCVCDPILNWKTHRNLDAHKMWILQTFFSHMCGKWLMSVFLTPLASNCASICLYHLVSQRPYPRIPAPRMAHATLSPWVLFWTLTTYVFNSVHHMQQLK